VKAVDKLILQSSPVLAKELPHLSPPPILIADYQVPPITLLSRQKP